MSSRKTNIPGQSFTCLKGSHLSAADPGPCEPWVRMVFEQDTMESCDCAGRLPKDRTGNWTWAKSRFPSQLSVSVVPASVKLSLKPDWHPAKTKIKSVNKPENWSHVLSEKQEGWEFVLVTVSETHYGANHRFWTEMYVLSHQESAQESV